MLTISNCRNSETTMKFFTAFALLASTLVSASETERKLSPSSRSSGKGRGRDRMLRVTVRNLAYDNPMGPFFVAVHNADFSPLYNLGMPAPDNGLQTLAEEGSPMDLLDFYDGDDNALFVGSFVDDSALNLPEGAAFLLELGESLSFEIPDDRKYPYVSMASMMVNTNDAFVGLRSVELHPGMSFTVPAYDSGTEENNEDCFSVPGPACGAIRNGEPSVQSGNGEGYVHVHRGIHGTFQGEPTDLDPSEYDWRNPSLLITVERA